MSYVFVWLAVVVEVAEEIAVTGGDFVVSGELADVSTRVVVVLVSGTSATCTVEVVISAGIEVVDVVCCTGSAIGAAAPMTTDVVPRAVGASVTSVRTLATAAAAMAIATRVAPVHAAAILTVLLMSTVCGKSVRSGLIQG